MILLASALSSIRTVCPNRLSRRRWIIAVGLGCFLSLRTPSLIPDKFGASSSRRHYWSSAVHRSYVRPSLRWPSSANHTGILARCMCCTASASFGVESRDLHIWLSRLCTAAQVVGLRRLMSQVLRVVKWRQTLQQP